MAHAHSHAEDQNTYYLDQLCTIGVCGALGGVAIILYQRGQLWFLAPKFHLPVLIGGLALLVLVAIRAVTLWFSVGTRGGTHDHSHEHGCGHDHGHACDHDHAHDHAHDHEHAHEHHPRGAALDHGHDHAWAPWRYAVLLVPVVLFFLNLPNEGFSVRSAPNIDAIEGAAAVADKGVDFKLGFLELQQAAFNEQQRELFEGKRCQLRGQFVPGPTDKQFSLVRYKITCCAADAVQLNLVILSPESLNIPALQQQWVRATGQIQFHKVRDQFMTVMLLKDASDAEAIPPDPNPFLN